jgi:hypothetical protein
MAGANLAGIERDERLAIGSINNYLEASIRSRSSL